MDTLPGGLGNTPNNPGGSRAHRDAPGARRPSPVARYPSLLARDGVPVAHGDRLLPDLGGFVVDLGGLGGTFLAISGDFAGKWKSGESYGPATLI